VYSAGRNSLRVRHMPQCVGDACGRRLEARLQAQLAAAEEAIRADMRRQLLQQRRALLQRLDAARSAREHNATMVSDPALTLGHAAAVALPAADAALDADRGAGASASGAGCTPHEGARQRLPERVGIFGARPPQQDRSVCCRHVHMMRHSLSARHF